jgi:peroxiredoxin Q/BCP
VSAAGPVRVGDRAPDFSLLSQQGTPVRLSDRIGKRVLVLYFYPKDNSPGCTAEACAFADRYETFAAAGADVIGVSSDPVDSHAGFAARHNLPFTLLSDPGGGVRRQYGVTTVLGLVPGRVTYVIDRQGVVRMVYSSLTRIGRHVDGAVALVRQLQSEHEAENRPAE